MTAIPSFYTKLAIGPAFLGARAQRLADLISEQGDAFLRAAGLIAPARSVSTLLHLRHNGPSSLVQIAKALGEPHQVTAKRTRLLEEIAMLSCNADPHDKRRRVFKLTPKGLQESARIEARCQHAAHVFEDLNRELDLHLGDALDAAFAALSDRSMLSRSNDTPEEQHDRTK